MIREGIDPRELAGNARRERERIGRSRWRTSATTFAAWACGQAWTRSNGVCGAS